MFHGPRSHCLRVLLIVSLLGLTCSHGGRALAYSSANEYLPPEILHAHRLAMRLSSPGQVNLNHADMLELQTLPGLSENLALQIIRLRPLNSLADLRRLNGVPHQTIEGLIETLQPRIRF